MPRLLWLLSFLALNLVIMSVTAQTYPVRIAEENGSGGIIKDHFSRRDYGGVTAVARTYCQNARLGSPSVKKRKEGCLLFCGTEFDEYEFSCGARPITANQISSADMDELGARCVQIGFQKGTPEYGQCVLKLLDINTRQSNESSPAININR